MQNFTLYLSMMKFAPFVYGRPHGTKQGILITLYVCRCITQSYSQAGHEKKGGGQIEYGMGLALKVYGLTFRF